MCLPLAAVLVWLLITRGSYGRVERILLALALSSSPTSPPRFWRPDWPEVFRQTLRPRPRLEVGYLQLLIVQIDTTISPIELFAILSLINNRELMGQYVNRGLYNLLVWVIAIVVSLLSLTLIAITVLGFINVLFPQATGYPLGAGLRSGRRGL